MIIAVDFDLTLALTDFPRIIRANPQMVDFCLKRQQAGDTLILWTCRKGIPLREAVEWCAAQGLVFNYINQNTKENIHRYGDCRKIYADIYVDDHNWTIAQAESEVR